MNNKTVLRLIFGFILFTLTAYNVWACSQQPLWRWGGLRTPPDNWWTIATFIDAYCGFVTFYIWVLYKERRFGSRLFWLVAVMGLGNIAVSAYLLLQLARLRNDQPAAAILTARR